MNVFLRAAAVVASLIFLALPAAAGPGDRGVLTGPSLYEIIDADCTDANDTPATTVNIDLTTVANWDTIGEAINPFRNRDDVTQTSGSADGWCDSKPWVIAGTITTAGNTIQYVGPLNVDEMGFMMYYRMLTIGTAYGFFLDFEAPWGGSNDTLAGLGAQTSTANNMMLFSPELENNGAVLNGDIEVPIPNGIPLYFRFDLDGAATWVIDVWWGGLKNPSTSGRN